MKTWKEISPYTGNAIEEDAPANNASSGDVAMPPDAVKKKKKTLIDRNMMDGRTTVYRQHRERLEARRAKREENRQKSKFIEKVKNEAGVPSSYDIAKPVADLNASKKKKK